LNVNERYDPRLKPVLWGFHYDDEFLRHLRPDLKSDGLLELFGDRVFNEPAVKLNLRIFDSGSILVLERKFFSIVLSKDGIALELLLFGDVHGHNLVFV